MCRALVWELGWGEEAGGQPHPQVPLVGLGPSSPLDPPLPHWEGQQGNQSSEGDAYPSEDLGVLLGGGGP